MANVDRTSSQKRKGFFARWFEAMAEARLRHAEQEVHQHIHEDLDRETAQERERTGH